MPHLDAHITYFQYSASLWFIIMVTCILGLKDKDNVFLQIYRLSTNPIEGPKPTMSLILYDFPPCQWHRSPLVHTEDVNHKCVVSFFFKG